jgi:hypothetical protein
VSAPEPSDGPAADRHRVLLLELPVALHARTQQHREEVQREMALLAVQLQTEGDSGALPRRLVRLIEELTSSYADAAAGPAQELDAAVDRGVDSVDLEYQVPRGAGEAAVRLAAILDETDEYCRSGQHLLTLATPEDQVAYRHWFCGQFADQIAGGPPVPWPQFAGRRLAG